MAMAPLLAQPNLLIAALCVIVVTLLALSFTASPVTFGNINNAAIGASTGTTNSRFVVYSKLLDPTLEVFNDTEYVYQIPAKPRAVLFLAHGCSCKATFFFDKHPKCETCIGAPEERALVIRALQSSYAVIAISSRDVCWSTKADGLRTKLVLEEWMDRFDLVDLPLVGLGASSGGYFVSAFAKSFLKFDAVVLMIAEGRFQSIPTDTVYPPVLFVHMPKDEIRAQRIGRIIPLLRKADIEADEIQCRELKITDKFFSKRIPYVDVETSGKLKQLLVRSGFVDKKLFLKMDGRDMDIDDALNGKENVELVATLSSQDRNWKHHVREELNVAYAYHEFTSIPSRKIIAWIESHVTMPFNATIENSDAR